MEHLIEHGPNDMATVFARAFELAMQIERERFLGAGRYERTPGRQGCANGYKPKRIDTQARSRCGCRRLPIMVVSRSTRNRWSAGGARCEP
ncbi:hypothetical protein DSM110093_03912 (plasmid) [Sulfitobacter sp. DSM 110093]|uniref:transposase n=1 Tax=Sulfitobacter sp. DSM 110093 TaxID=2883127 RepID=UPI001FAC08B3|nr:transposase [Sulfitobacter sp. DSM 110093]UOA34077.1 hypothetical protein DSM110093_03912 [Sulfitobacter sp. DSM 110093]